MRQQRHHLSWCALTHEEEGGGLSIPHTVQNLCLVTFFDGTHSPFQSQRKQFKTQASTPNPAKISKMLDTPRCAAAAHTPPLFCKCDNLSVNFAFPIPRKSQVHACGKPFCRRRSSHHPSCYSLPSKPTPAVAGACGAAAAVGRGSNAAARCKASCLRRLFSACLRCTCATCRKPSQCGCPCPASLRHLPISSHVAVSRTPVDIAEADA